MIDVIDQLANRIQLKIIPKRIVSLVPSQTELLFDLGLENQVVGITKFCIHPNEWFHSKTRVGGTKNVDFSQIKALKPDLIIGNKEENTQSDIEQLRTMAPVWMSDIETIEDALNMILSIGELTDKRHQAVTLSNQIRADFEALKKLNHAPWTCLYFMWKNPYMTVGPNTFIHEMIALLGGVNLQKESRYPVYHFSNEQPDVLFLSSEPYPFNEKHVKFFSEKFPKSKIILVDGEYFSWYGSRMLKATSYFRHLLVTIHQHSTS